MPCPDFVWLDFQIHRPMQMTVMPIMMTVFHTNQVARVVCVLIDLLQQLFSVRSLPLNLIHLLSLRIVKEEIPQNNNNNSNNNNNNNNNIK